MLGGWTRAVARFREDANAEEDLVRGAYRDRVVVELAQNAADAAQRAGVPGVLRLELTAAAAGARAALRAANTGAPLDAAGVQGLATLRASSKRDEPTTVGRFGVGFAAVLAVSDAPSLHSTSGGVAFSAERTRDEVLAAARACGANDLLTEVDRRGGHVPVLRLPFPAPAHAAGAEAEAFTTEVVLPLRDAAAEALVRRLLAEVGPALLVALPGLTEVRVAVPGAPERVVRSPDATLVRRTDRHGEVSPALLADRPVEERGHTAWRVTWVAPRPAEAAAVLHAPTPTDEPVALPALLVATFPLDPGRRHVAPGAMTDHLVAQAAAGYADLVASVAVSDGLAAALALVPGPVAAGPLDAELRAAVATELADRPWLPAGLAPRDAVVIPGLPEAAAALLAEAVPGLLALPGGADREAAALDRLGATRGTVADAVDELAGLDRPPGWWRALYDALGEAVAAGRLGTEELAVLPVPRAGDGRLARGPRTTVLPPPAGDPLLDPLVTLGLPVVHPSAEHPLLARLGATPPDPAVLLARPEVAAAVRTADAAVAVDDLMEADDLAAAVLALVAAAGPGAVAALDPRTREAIAQLPLPDVDGGRAPAGELLLPGSPLAAVVDPDALGTVATDVVERWGEDVLADAGCLRTFALVVEDDVPVDPDLLDHGVAGEEAWADHVLDRLDDAAAGSGAAALPVPPQVAHLRLVRDLDLVSPHRWNGADGALALLARDPELRRAVVEPVRVLADDGTVLVVPSQAAWWLGRHAVVGGRRPSQTRLPDDGPGWPTVDPVLARLLPPAPADTDPAFLAALGVRTSLADVAPTPAHLPLLQAGLLVPDGVPPDQPGDPRPVPEVARSLLAGAPVPPPQWYAEHDDLTVGDLPVEWWVELSGDKSGDETGAETGEPTVHAATVDGLARGLAWATGAWPLRHLLAAVIAEPDRLEALVAEQAWDDLTGSGGAQP